MGLKSLLLTVINLRGDYLTIKGRSQGEPFKEPEFYNAMLRIWLGSNPADWKLKEALLGNAS